MTTKLTLSIDSKVLAKARRISKLRKISISAMVAHYIASIREDESPEEPLAPLTQRVLELGQKVKPVSADWDYRDELADIIAERYGAK
ncbi:MAG: DUF6364 family protein [Lentisphaeria bacterium]|nr:DUF6364 family protein [Lentisphaeria bacterium]